jgi:hypothetical protein
MSSNPRQAPVRYTGQELRNSTELHTYCGRSSLAGTMLGLPIQDIRYLHKLCKVVRLLLAWLLPAHDVVIAPNGQAAHCLAAVALTQLPHG